MAITARTATTVPSSFSAIERMNGSSIAGSAVTMAPIRMALRPQQRRHDTADHAQLGQPLGKIRQRLFGEQTSEAGHRRNSRQLRLDQFGREHDAVLHDVAGESGDAQNQKRQAESGGDIEGQRLHQRRQRRAVGRDLIRFGDEPPERGLQARRHRRGEHHDRQRAAGDGEPGVHLHAFDDVAAAKRFFQASWCRIFCPLVRFAVLFGHEGCARLVEHDLRKTGSHFSGSCSTRAASARAARRPHSRERSSSSPRAEEAGTTARSGSTAAARQRTPASAASIAPIRQARC